MSGNSKAGIFGWDYPLLTFIYPGFDGGLPVLPLVGSVVVIFSYSFHIQG